MAWKPQDKKILVVDQPGVARLIEVNLQRRGYRVVKVFFGEEALTKVDSERPDLIILEIQLPRIDGWEVIECLRADPETAEIPIIVLTQLVGAVDVNRCSELGCPYHAKPFNPDELLDQIRRIFESLQGFPPDPDDEELHRSDNIGR